MTNSMHISKEENRNISAYDFETEKLYRITDTSNKIALKGREGGKYNLFDYFDSVQELLESARDSAIIPFFCSKREIKGKRYQVTLITRRETIEFWNLEKTESGWLKHELDSRNPDAPKIGIEICEANCAYMFYVEKYPDSLNGVRVKSVKKLEK